MTGERVLVFGNTDPKVDNISAAQLDPFFHWRLHLGLVNGFHFTHAPGSTFRDLVEACGEGRWDVAFLRPHWAEPAQAATEAMELVRRRNPDMHVIFLDPWDQTSTRYFGALPYVDAFLKYQRLAEVADYGRPMLGGHRITDYLARVAGIDLEGWDVSSAVPEGMEHKIDTYWHIVFAKNMRRLRAAELSLDVATRAARLLPVTPLERALTGLRERRFDLHCRMSFGGPGKLSWYGLHRLAAVRSIQGLEGRYSLAVDFDPEEARKVSRKQYLYEIRRSRMVLSPFGWGEVSWRDYEAAIYGCLLLKPRIDHVHTEPDVFRAGETYVPLEWDFSDAEEKCVYYLEHPEEAARIVANLRAALVACLTPQYFGKLVTKALALAARNHERARGASPSLASASAPA